MDPTEKKRRDTLDTPLEGNLEAYQRRGVRRWDRAIGLMTQAFFGSLLLAVLFYFNVLWGFVERWL